MAYFRIEPFGEERDDVRAALIAQTVANCLVERKDGRKFTLKDFMLDWDGSHQPKPKTSEEMLIYVRAMHDVITAMNSTNTNG